MVLSISSYVAIAALIPTVFSHHVPRAHSHFNKRDGCKQTYYSLAGEDCDDIASHFGVTKDDIFNANTFLNCDDVWAGTPICINVDGPASSTCVQTYHSIADDTCEKIGGYFGMTAAEVKAANGFLTCNDIWVGTPICITTNNAPPTPPATQECKQTYKSIPGDTCEKIGGYFGLTAAEVLAANSFLNCNDIWTNTPICITNNNSPPANTGCDVTYYSRDGDTCSSIAYKFGTSSDTIHNANSFVDCNNIWKGTSICIPPGINSPCTQTIKSQPGDTCWTIGDRYNVNGEVIKYWNQFLDCNNIWYKRSEVNNTFEIRAPREENTLRKRFGPSRMTWYDVGQGACGWWNNPGDFIVAMNYEQFGGYDVYPPTICGSQIVIDYNGKQVQATVADECPDPYCHYGELDLSAGLFSQFTSQGDGVFYGTWWFGTLGDGGNNGNNGNNGGGGGTSVCVSH